MTGQGPKTGSKPGAKRRIVYSSRHEATITDGAIPDIDRDAVFGDLFMRVRDYTMTSKEGMFATYQAARYVAQRNIPGDLVECGVWRGGSALLAALTARHYAPDAPRLTWLYDTFEGMTAPTGVDIDKDGGSAAAYMAQYGDDGKWCYADEADVRAVFAAQAIGDDQIRVVRGDVVETLPRQHPGAISLLRLDTDWYASTLAELEILYPRLSTGGVLILDDYGHWNGARQAVDEFFARNPPLYLGRVGHSVRVAIKV